MGVWLSKIEPRNLPEWLRYDDNRGNAYGIYAENRLLGIVHKVESSRSWVAHLPNGDFPGGIGEIIDATTRSWAVELFVRYLASSDHSSEVSGVEG
jgi:hypothetical protein